MNKQLAVIFDMDGVLVFNSNMHDQAWQLFCQKYKIGLAADEIKKLFGGTNRSFLTAMFGDLSDKKVHELAEEKEAIYRDIYKDIIKLPEGLVELLEELNKAHIPIAVATSAPTSNVDFVLDQTGLRKYFSHIIDETFVKKGKPDPEVYLIASQKLDIKPSHCIVFEDSIVGIEAAINAGMKVIGLTSTFPKNKISKATLIIDSYKEINLEKIKDINNA